MTELPHAAMSGRSLSTLMTAGMVSLVPYRDRVTSLDDPKGTPGVA